MPLFAQDNQKKTISVSKASLGERYFCRECGGVLALRRKSQRSCRHFYHVTKNSCKSAAKSFIHLAAQEKITSSLPEGEGVMEKAFPEIGRIADVAWETKKIVFEVQCSPITLVEIKARTFDYHRAGWQVVWLLHLNRFGKKELTAAELFLRSYPHYFCDFNEEGSGQIMDRIVFGKNSSVIKEKWIGPVALFSPQEKGDSLSFSGDSCSQISKNKELKKLIRKWRYQKNREIIRKLYLGFLKKPFLSWLHAQLESVSRS